MANSSPEPGSPNGHDIRPTPSISTRDVVPENTMKIMLATDNHIGYLERDPIRGQDSFDAFREILQLAKEQEVDFVLLAGDLFHENNPSRYTIHQTMAMLREFSHGDKPVQIELLSDPDEGRPDGYNFPAINYEDYNINVGIPVFSIHGNHDDPQGTSAAGALSAVDLLSVAGLVNYFGKTDLAADEERSEATKKGLNISPVLLKKGDTKLALYGIGNIKDKRLNAEMRHGRVRMLKPAEGGDEWFNCVLVHQNRVAHNKNEFVPEDMFDDATDLVVWGHEHDCRIVPEAVSEKDYWITQPGSSVATSLAEGESIQKQVAILRIQGKKFDIEPIPLRSVRPFVLRHIDMGEAAEEHGFDASNKNKVKDFLVKQVLECVEEANAQWDERNGDLAADENGPKRPKPLIRLKVDTSSGSELTNISRFGESLNHLVANPGNLLQFHRRRVIQRKDKVYIDDPDNSDDDGLVAGQRGTKLRMADLVQTYLEAQELNVLPANALADAVENFVEKGTKGAIKDFVAETLKSFNANARAKNINEDDIDAELVNQQKAAVSQFQTEHDDEDASVKKSTKTKKRLVGDSDDEMQVDQQAAQDSFAEDSDEGQYAPAKKTAPAAKKAPAKGKGKGKEQSLFDDGSDDDDVSMDDDEESDEAPVKKRASSKTASAKAPPKKAPAPKKKATPAPAKKSTQSQLSFEPVRRKQKAPTVLSVSDSD